MDKAPGAIPDESLFGRPGWPAGTVMAVQSTITDWIVAVTGVLTLGAAVAAGVYAQRAAHWTKAQAEATTEEVKLAQAALAVAQQEAQDARDFSEHQRREAQAASRRLAEARIDAAMPTVLARATPGVTIGDERRCVLEIGRRAAGGSTHWIWTPVEEPLELRADDDVLFRTSVTVHLQNISPHIAQIAIIDPARGEVSVRSGEAILVPPGDEKTFTWTRVLSMAALRADGGVDQPEHWLMNVKLWVRDLGMNAYDVVLFNADLRFFSRDGSRLVVKPEPPFPWQENVGQPLPGRVYERFDAAGTSTT